MRARSGPHEVQASLLGPTMRVQREISNLPCVEDSLDTGDWDLPPCLGKTHGHRRCKNHGRRSFWKAWLPGFEGS